MTLAQDRLPVLAVGATPPNPGLLSTTHAIPALLGENPGVLSIQVAFLAQRVASHFLQVDTMMLERRAQARASVLCPGV